MRPLLPLVLLLATTMTGCQTVGLLWFGNPDPAAFEAHSASRPFDHSLGDVTRAFEEAFRAEGLVVRSVDVLHIEGKRREQIGFDTVGFDQSNSLKGLADKIDGRVLTLDMPKGPTVHHNLENVSVAATTKDGRRVWTRADIKDGNCVVSIVAGRAPGYDPELSRRLLDRVAEAIEHPTTKPAVPKP